MVSFSICPLFVIVFRSKSLFANVNIHLLKTVMLSVIVSDNYHWKQCTPVAALCCRGGFFTGQTEISAHGFLKALVHRCRLCK